MEENTHNYPHRPKFHGTGGQLFTIFIVNVVLTIITLGLYYPWARVNLLQFLYRETEFMGHRFEFTGSGKEVFIGFIKVVALFLLLGLLIAFVGAFGKFVAFVAYILIIPVAVHGALSYRLSRTYWNDIRFGYQGDLGTLVKMYVKGFLLTMVTLGIYSPWFLMEVRRYAMGHMRAGSAKFSFDGQGGEFFKIFFLGYLLTIITAGIYSFWWIRDMYNYMWDHTSIEHEGEFYSFQGSATAGKVFELVFVNFILILFTLGIGTPWAMVRQYRFNCDNMMLDPAFDPAGIEDTQGDFPDATGEGLMAMLELDLL